MRGKHDFVEETSLVPYAAAMKVIEDAQLYADEFLPDEKRFEIAEALVEQVEDHYEANPSWRRKLKGPNGRDALYAYMEHWLAAELKRRAPGFFRKLPHGYGWSARLSRG